MSRTVRVGVLGAGAIAQVVHLPILGRMRGVEVAYLCDTDLRRARTIAERMGIPKVYSDDECVADGDVDALVICTPSDLHEEQCVAALEAGKHVLCEKPLALTDKGVRRILDAAERSEGTVTVAMNQRFRPDVVPLKAFLEGKELGRIMHMSAGWITRESVPSRPSWRTDPERAGGGALMDLGIQILDLAIWLLGDPRPERISASVQRMAGMKVEEFASLFVTFAGGTSLHLEAGWNGRTNRDRQFFKLLGTDGSASMAPFEVHKIMDGNLVDLTPALPPRRENPYTLSYRQELQYFVEVVRGQRSGELPVEQAVLMQVIAGAYQSASTGKEVGLNG